MSIILTMNIKEFLKGIIIGIAKIIPGLSGAVLMISFNLYDRAIYAITNFFENPKKNFIFLANLSLGILIGIVFFSKVISFFINHYYTYTTFLFIGLILGGFPILFKKIDKTKKNYLIMIISFIIMTALSLSGINNTYTLKHNYIDIIIFFISGLLEALGTVLPGISSTALLMLLGIYNTYITTISNLFDLTLIKETITFLIPFSLGILIGVISITILINYLFKHHYQLTFSLILGVSISSVLLLIIKVFIGITSLTSLIISILILSIGYFIMSKI